MSLELAVVSCIITMSPSPTSSTNLWKTKMRSVWMCPHIATREAQGACVHLVQELRQKERDNCNNFSRIQPHVFQNLLTKLAPHDRRKHT